MTFELCRYSFVLRALGPIDFRRSGPANLLRGAFGSALRKAACAPECPGFAGRAARACAQSSTCAYARIFEPVSEGGPSGLANPPRPFVFRAAHLAGRTFEAGEHFCFDVNFFDTRRPALDEFARAFAQLARADVVSSSSEPLSLSLDACSGLVNRVSVEFRTPAELKAAKNGTALAARPEFAVLFARARDRVSTLRALYGPGPLDIDFRSMGRRAREIKMTHCDLQHVKAARRSRRTGQVHGVGGFTGVVEYAGDLGEFVPILEAARWTGVGRHCVWGNGEIVPRVILDA